MAEEKNTGTEAPASSGMGAGGKIAIVAILAVAVVAVIWLKGREKGQSPVPPTGNGAVTVNDKGPDGSAQTRQPAAAIPKLVDLGAGKCIPCKMMAPILEELKKEYAGRFEVTFIDVWQNPGAGKQYGINIIPTQIFYDASGKELFRHEGFFSKEDILKKWKELGIELDAAAPAPAPAPVPAQPAAGETSALIREEPLVRDSRAPEQVCSMCEGTIEPKSRVVVDAPWGKANLCSVHCYAIYHSSLRDARPVEGRVLVTDWATGQSAPLATAAYLCSTGKDDRPVVRAFASREAAAAEAAGNQGKVLAWEDLLKQELAVRCAFCDRGVYRSDATLVYTLTPQAGGGCCGPRAEPLAEEHYACCPMCGLGVAARTKKDIGLQQKDALTGELVAVTTELCTFCKVEPPTAVAWHGQRKGKDGKMASAGCFHQFFFASEDNLRKWLEKHPGETGRMVTIKQALADKMALTTEQIGNACKIGECRP